MMRAKMRVESISRVSDTQETISMRAVTGDAAFGPEGESEDNTYARYTPMGTLTLSITNPSLIGKFSQNQKFYLDFTPAE